MSQSLSRKVFWFSAKAALGVVAVFGGVYYARWLMTVDPFQKYRTQKTSRLGENIAMRLSDVNISTYDNGKLVSRAFVKRVDIQSDRQNLNLTGIQDGVMIGREGKFNFTANKAYYRAFQGVLNVMEGARIKNKDMNISVDGFTYSEQAGRLQSIGVIRGRMGDGDVQAIDLDYSTKDGSYSTGPITWTGLITSPFEAQSTSSQAEPKAQRSKWTIKSENSKQVNEMRYYTDVRATDGEVIVKAPKAEHNTKTDVLTATGRVYYYSPQANLVCDKVIVYRKEKRAVLSGKVTMLIKPKDEEKLEEVEVKPFDPIVPDDIKNSRPAAPKKEGTNPAQDADSLRKYPVQVFADQIEYWYAKGSRRAKITGKPQARQELPEGEWRHAWSNTAFYDGEEETLKLESREGKKDARMKTSIGDDAIALWFKISTKENEDSWEGQGVEGDFVTPDDEIPRTTGGGGGGGGTPLRGNIGGGAQPPKKGSRKP